MPIAIGAPLPDATFKLPAEGGPVEKTTADIFKGKRVVLFAVPGAFTPTCHRNHLPGYVEHAAAFKAKGIDTIAVTAVNDVHVMGAWKAATGADGIEFLADGSAVFAKAVGLDNDSSAFGMGVRSKRYAMLVEDGVVKTLLIEDSPGKAEVSGAPNLLSKL
jgi:peroxiredoxin